MLKKRILLLILTVILILNASLIPASAANEDGTDDDTSDTTTVRTEEEMQVYSKESGFPIYYNETVAAASAILVEEDSGMILFAQDIDKQVHPLSLAKILTVLVAVENGNLDDMVTVSGNLYTDVSSDFRNGDLCVGEVISLRDLIYRAMLPSENDACNVIAEHIGGTIENFVKMLNERAAEIGCTGSNFVNAHGLPDENEYTTARDLALITCEALKNDTFREICYTTSYELAETNFHEAKKIYTTNYMISTALSNKYYYSDARGVKYGGITAAYGCSLIVGGHYSDIDVVAVVVGSSSHEESSSPGEYYLECFSEAKILLQYAYNHYISLNVLNPDIAVGSLPVEDGTVDAVIVKPTDSAGLSVPKKYNLKDITVKVSGSVTAPAKTGDIVGTASLYYKDVLIAEVPVTPICDVTKADEDHPTQSVRIEEQMEEDNQPKEPSSLLIIMIVVLVFVMFYLMAYIYYNIKRAIELRTKPRKHTKHKGTD